MGVVVCISFVSKVVCLRGDLSARFVRGAAPSSGWRAGGHHCDYLPAAVGLGGRSGVLRRGSRGAMGGAEVESRGSRRRGVCIYIYHTLERCSRYLGIVLLFHV